MPGQQADFAIKGDLFEIAAENVLSEVLSMISVPRQRDYGIDFYCSVRFKFTKYAQTTRDLFALQVGGPDKTIEYGGLRDKTPLQYQIDWLKSLTIPLFFARVSNDRERVDVYSMSPIWRILFRSPGAFQIKCTFEEPTDEPFTIQAEQPIPFEGENSYGDANVWRI